MAEKSCKWADYYPETLFFTAQDSIFTVYGDFGSLKYGLSILKQKNPALGIILIVTYLIKEEKWDV